MSQTIHGKDRNSEDDLRALAYVTAYHALAFVTKAVFQRIPRFPNASTVIKSDSSPNSYKIAKHSGFQSLFQILVKIF